MSAEQMTFLSIDASAIMAVLADGHGHRLAEISRRTGYGQREIMHILAKAVLDDKVECFTGFIYRLKQGAKQP